MVCILSVGDHKFKKKSFKKMLSLINESHRTVVIVSHSIASLRSLCQNVIWMHDGEIRRIGEANAVLDEYEEFMS